MSGRRSLNTLKLLLNVVARLHCGLAIHLERTSGEGRVILPSKTNSCAVVGVHSKRGATQLIAVSSTIKSIESLLFVACSLLVDLGVQLIDKKSILHL